MLPEIQVKLQVTRAGGLTISNDNNNSGGMSSVKIPIRFNLKIPLNTHRPLIMSMANMRVMENWRI